MAGWIFRARITPNGPLKRPGTMQFYARRGQWRICWQSDGGRAHFQRMPYNGGVRSASAIVRTNKTPIVRPFHTGIHGPRPSSSRGRRRMSVRGRLRWLHPFKATCTKQKPTCTTPSVFLVVSDSQGGYLNIFIQMTALHLRNGKVSKWLWLRLARQSMQWSIFHLSRTKHTTDVSRNWR